MSWRQDRLAPRTALVAELAAVEAKSSAQEREIWRLRRELTDLHRAIAEDRADAVHIEPWDRIGIPPPTPRSDCAIDVRLAYARRELANVLDELEFRTRNWRASLDQGWAHPYDHGFALPDTGAPKNLTPSRTHRKTFRDRPAVTGLTARQAFSLEARCLMRLQELGEQARFFPAPLQFSASEPSITTVHVGRSLDMIPAGDQARMAALISDSYLEQIDGMIEALKRGAIVHLDLLKNGRNVVIGDEGRLSLVDFDIAVIDDHPFSAEIQRRHQEWSAGGGYERTRRQLVVSVEQFLGRAAGHALQA